MKHYAFPIVFFRVLLNSGLYKKVFHPLATWRVSVGQFSNVHVAPIVESRVVVFIKQKKGMAVSSHTCRFLDYGDCEECEQRDRTIASCLCNKANKQKG